MRLPRPRISVRWMIVIVAVLAGGMAVLLRMIDPLPPDWKLDDLDPMVRARVGCMDRARLICGSWPGNAKKVTGHSWSTPPWHGAVGKPRDRPGGLCFNCTGTRAMAGSGTFPWCMTSPTARSVFTNARPETPTFTTSWTLIPSTPFSEQAFLNSGSCRQVCESAPGTRRSEKGRSASSDSRGLDPRECRGGAVRDSGEDERFPAVRRVRC